MNAIIESSGAESISGAQLLQLTTNNDDYSQVNNDLGGLKELFGAVDSLELSAEQKTQIKTELLAGVQVNGISASELLAAVEGK